MIRFVVVSKIIYKEVKLNVKIVFQSIFYCVAQNWLCSTVFSLMRGLIKFLNRNTNEHSINVIGMTNLCCFSGIIFGVVFANSVSFGLSFGKAMILSSSCCFVVSFAPTSIIDILCELPVHSFSDVND